MEEWRFLDFRSKGFRFEFQLDTNDFLFEKYIGAKQRAQNANENIVRNRLSIPISSDGLATLGMLVTVNCGHVPKFIVRTCL